MNIKKINKSEYIVNGKKYEFMNYTKYNRNGFNHNSTFYVNGMYLGESNIHYVNRTWESFKYQTSMLGVINSMIDNLYITSKNNFKQQHNIKRLRGKNKELFEKQFNDKLFIQELKELKKLLKYY